MTTVYDGSETVVCTRKRPISSHRYSGPIKQFFGDEPVKEVPIQAVAFDYNHYMNGVDIADHLRSNMRTGNHRQRRGPARALAWDFLLKTAVSNSFILQRDGQPAWPRYRSLGLWQEAVSDELCRKYWSIYRKEKGSRERYRAGNEFIHISQHHWVDRGKRSYCLGCQALQISPRTRSFERPIQRPRKRRCRPGPDLDENPHPDPPEAPKVKTTEMGCDVCDVAICNAGQCWYIYHRPIY